MKINIISIAFLWITNLNLCLGQDFINGDLDGIVSGLSSLPTNWQKVPFDDINCLGAQIGNDTPDLTNLNGPSAPDGASGIAFSGSTFISGIFAKNLPNFFQEGIMQQVSGFTSGQVYRINLRQSVVKGISAIDKSGSWAVYLDTILAGVTSPSYSDEPFNSLNLLWEARSINFTATATSHLIKFLPMDDDTNWLFSNSDTLGALYMGIDSIGLEVVTGIHESTSKNFNISPNPNTGCFKLQYNGILSKKTMLCITDVYGKITDTKEIVNTTTDYENTSLPVGLYFYSLRQGAEEVGRGKFLIIK
jgi:hypothetical protein